MPRRTTRTTRRKSSSSNIPSRQYSQNSNTPTNKYQSQTNVPQNTVMGNVAQGMTLGAGAALGSSIVHGTLGSISKQTDNSKEESQNNNQQINDDEIRCGHLMRQFKDCCTSYSDLNNCKPLLDYYVSCMSNNTKL